MADHESVDDRLNRYKAKVRIYRSNTLSVGIFCLILLLLLPPAWYGFLYWVRNRLSYKKLSNGQQLGVFTIGLVLGALSLLLILLSLGLLLVDNVIFTAVIIPPLWIYQNCKRTFSAHPLLLMPLSRVCTARTRRDWDDINSFEPKLCKECQKMVTNSILLNGSMCGVAYPVEKYRHHNFTALVYSAQQCLLCNCFLKSAQQCWKTELKSATTEQKLSKLQIELRAVKIPKGGTSVLLKLLCMDFLGYVTLTIDEIHNGRPEK
jgi:hypothetical protein